MNLKLLFEAQVAPPSMAAEPMFVQRLAATTLFDARDPRYYGAVGDGTADDSDALQASLDAMPAHGHWRLAPGVYRITKQINVINHPGCVLDFGNALIVAGPTFTGDAMLYFRAMTSAIVQGINVHGNSLADRGVWFDAHAGETTIHLTCDKITAMFCGIGVQVGTDVQQVDECNFGDIYASACGTGVLVRWENTLSIVFGKLEAYLCTDYGVQLHSGSGVIKSLAVAPEQDSTCLFIGPEDGVDGGLLSRWEILSGYSELGPSGSKFLGSAKQRIPTDSRSRSAFMACVSHRSPVWIQLCSTGA